LPSAKPARPTSSCAPGRRRTRLLEGADKAKPVLLAYEPVWAIGVNGIPASSDYADERHAD
jgi:triosephosphate isomerase